MESTQHVLFIKQFVFPHAIIPCQGQYSHPKHGCHQGHRGCVSRTVPLAHTVSTRLPKLQTKQSCYLRVMHFLHSYCLFRVLFLGFVLAAIFSVRVRDIKMSNVCDSGSINIYRSLIKCHHYRYTQEAGGTMTGSSVVSWAKLCTMSWARSRSLAGRPPYLTSPPKAHQWRSSGKWFSTT